MHIDYRKLVHRYHFPGRFASELITLFERNNKTPARERHTTSNVSFKIAYCRLINTCAAFHDLHTLGYKLQSLYNFQERHVKILVKHWEQQGHSVGTIENKLSYLRTLAKWLGKIGMIKESRTYASDPASFNRKCITVEDKTWTGHDVDPLVLIDKLRKVDPIVAMQLELQWGFGLRVEESMLLRPAQAFMEALDRLTVHIEYGTKGGRPRETTVDDVAQIDVLERATQLARGLNKT